MVLAFVRAECNSPRFSDRYPTVGSVYADLFDNPNLNDATQNEARRNLLDYRGYRKRIALFQGFPMDVRWRRARLEESDVERLLYANYPTWRGLSKGTRRVEDGAANIDLIQVGENANANVHGIAKLVASGEVFPELIGVEDGEGKLVIVEGHARVTAYVLENRVAGAAIILGSSPTMQLWPFC